MVGRDLGRQCSRAAAEGPLRIRRQESIVRRDQKGTEEVYFMYSSLRKGMRLAWKSRVKQCHQRQAFDASLL